MGDVEKKSTAYADGTSTYVGEAPPLYDTSKESLLTRLGLTAESFKRAPGTTGGLVTYKEGATDEEIALARADNPMLQQKMKPRHLQMIAVGGSIGTGLFIGSGGALNTGGPLGILLGWIIMGFMLLCTCQAIGEMAIMYPVSGGFYQLTSRFLDPSWAFAMGWNYVLQWAVTLPLEITAAGFVVQYWTDAVPIAGWVAIFWFAIIFINLFGTLGYAEEEFWSSCLKLLVVVMFIFIGIVCNCGGGPSGGDYSSYVGGRYWHDPGMFANGFKGVCSVFVTAAFSFAGTELVGLAASETTNPRRTMPSAIKNTFWRITVIYIVSLTIIGLLVPWNDERLLGGNSDYDANTSPFVIVMDRAGVPGLPHLVNATICISVLSIGLSCVYGGSRVLTSLAETGYAPRVFTYVDKSGRPLYSVIALLLFGPIAFVGAASQEVQGEVFNWLLAISGLATLFTWGSILLCHIRFRRAWQVQGHSTDELPFKAFLGVWGSWIGFILIVLVLTAQFYVAVWPIGGASSPSERASGFFQKYLAAPIVIAFYIVGYAWKRTTPHRAMDIDLDTGRKCWESAETLNAERARLRARPLWRRIWHFLFQ